MENFIEFSKVRDSDESLNINWGQYEYLICYLCLPGISRFTPMVVGLNAFFTQLIEFAEFSDSILEKTLFGLQSLPFPKRHFTPRGKR